MSLETEVTMHHHHDTTRSHASVARPKLFGDIREHHVTFCIDTSGTMYWCLDTIKQHLIETLESHSHHRSRGTKDDDDLDVDTFNLIEFSTEVVQWSDRMVEWTPDTVAVAAHWIRALTPKTGTNTRDALLLALSNPTCDAVYVVTDSIPDQRPEGVIDSVMRACGSRPIHAVYVQQSGSNAPDAAAVAFLQELTMETFGSFYIATISKHDDIESLTPVYRAEATAERLVRTTSGNIYPTSYKLCSVGTSLDGPPVAVCAPPAVHGGYFPVFPPWPYSLYPWPYRYYHYLLLPPHNNDISMRYRPAKAWLKHTQEFVDQIVGAPVPGAGAMLIGSRVLARRHNDGFFYMGTVKSQILDNKFLVEFGPCQHGKFKETEYQETYVYDIVSHADALRHPVLLDDKVLAPWESEGERYAPGVVISGHEKRMADGGEPDEQLIVTFHDGKTSSVSRNKAMWIPHELYERIVFEISLPKNVRKDFASQEQYPFYNGFGYPASGSLAFPAQFEWRRPGGIGIGWDGGHCRGYPWMAHADYGRSVSRDQYDLTRTGGMLRSGTDELVPGTNLTKAQLNEKVMTQIMRNKVTSSAMSQTNGRKSGSLDGTGLRKSVSFADLKTAEDSKLDMAMDLSDAKDSGRGSQVELSFSDDDFDLHTDTDSMKMTRDVGVGTTRCTSLSSLRKSRSASPQRHMWRYWKGDPAPSLLEPMHYGAYRQGPYHDCIDSPSVLLRDAKKNSLNTVEWTSPIGRVVDPSASYKYQPTVKDSLYMPHPPHYDPPKQGPGVDLSDAIGAHQRANEQLAEARRDFKQRQVLAREIGWQRRAADEEHARQMAQEYRRQRTGVQIEQEMARAQSRHVDDDRRLAARRQMQDQMSHRMRENAENLEKREAQRIAALAMNRINRTLQTAERMAETQQVYAHRQAVREMQNVARNEARMRQISELELQSAAQHKQNVRKQAAHVQHFRQLENDAQKRKQLQTHVSDQTKAIQRSQIFF